MSAEPILTDEDRRIWDMWQRTARAHATTNAYRKRVDSSLGLLEKSLAEVPNAVIAWSGGKDSTVMTHLVCVRFGAKLPVFSEKDDMDYPGEEAYVRALGAAWGLDLSIVYPDISPWQWLESHREQLRPGGDLHSRSAGLSKACFYPVVEACNNGFDVVMLGLRAAESNIRRHLRHSRGRFYELASGKHRLLPIADWTGLDVLAYAAAHDIELLPVYRCVALLHADEPWRIRKSWWLPGTGYAGGQISWLRRYYPSLYAQMCEWMPRARMFA